MFFPTLYTNKQEFNDYFLDVVNTKRLFATFFQVHPVSQQSLRMGWRALAGLGASLARWVRPVCWGSQDCPGFARPETAAFMHRCCAKSRVWWKDPWLQMSKPQNKLQVPPGKENISSWHAQWRLFNEKNCICAFQTIAEVKLYHVQLLCRIRATKRL